MNEYITMPSLGADMTEGKLLKWRIKVGDRVSRGQIIADIETQKAAFEMESFKDGFVTSLDAQPSQVIPVGGRMATLSFVEDKIKSSNQTLIAPPLDTASLVDVRGAIAKAMSRSKKEIPHYYLKTTIGFDHLLKRIDQLNETLAPEHRLLLPSVIAKIVADSLMEHPEMNGYFMSNQFESRADINLGIVISVKNKGLLVPCLLGAQAKPLNSFNTEFKDLIERTRRGKLRTREISEATFTITNLGDLGVEEVFGIIYPPQVALLGIGNVIKAPVWKEERWQSGFVATFTLSGDHRVSDGISGSRFLNEIKKRIEGALLDEAF